MRSNRWKRSRPRRRSRLLAAVACCVAALASAAPAAAQTTDGGARRVAAYWADWEYWADTSFTHDAVDFSRLTHVNYAFAWNDEAGIIYFTDQFVFDGLGARSFSGGPGDGPVKCSPPFWHPFSTFDSSKHPAVCQGWNDHVSGFTKSVHDAGAKAILSVGGWTLSHRVSEMLASAAARAAFVDNAAALLQDWGFDGLDLDFEFPAYAPHGGRPIDKANYVLLLQALRQRFDAIEAATGRHLELTAAVSCGPSIANAAYDYAAVVSLLDYVNLMAYDFGGDWDAVAQHASPLYAYPGQVNAGFDADGCREFWMTTGGAPAEKLVLGMAHYGRSAANATAIGGASGGHDGAHWSGDTETRYYQIVEKAQTDPTFHTAYDAVAGTHVGWFDGGGFISFEDTTSIDARARYVVDQGLAGVMIWQLRGGMLRANGGYQYPLLDAALDAFAGSPAPDPDTTYTIVASAGEGGGIAPSGTIEVAGGGTVRFMATADAGYVVESLEVDGVTYDGTSYTFTNVDADHVIEARFVAATDTGAGECAPFVQPYGHDPGYAIGDKILFQGTAYVSTHEPNWWSPAAAPALWEATSCEASDDGGDGDGDDGDDDGGDGDDGGGGGALCVEFVQPFAGDEPYQIGDTVLFGGTAYVSTTGANWWSPSAAPSYWQETTCDDSGGDGTDDGDTDPGDDDAGGGTCPDFSQPYAGDAPYQVGDKVVFDGQVYVSTFGPNWWSPRAAPGYWSASGC